MVQHALVIKLLPVSIDRSQVVDALFWQLASVTCWLPYYVVETAHHAHGGKSIWAGMSKRKTTTVTHQLASSLSWLLTSSLAVGNFAPFTVDHFDPFTVGHFAPFTVGQFAPFTVCQFTQLTAGHFAQFILGHVALVPVGHYRQVPVDHFAQIVVSTVDYLQLANSLKLLLLAKFGVQLTARTKPAASAVSWASS